MSDTKMAPVYSEIAHALARIRNLRSASFLRPEMADVVEADLLDFVKAYMPSGSGVDAGTKLDLDKCKEDKIVFTFGFHHMNEGGYYDGWTEHTCVVRPSFIGEIDIKITGRDRNQIKDYLYEVYRHALTRMVNAYSCSPVKPSLTKPIG